MFKPALPSPVTHFTRAVKNLLRSRLIMNNGRLWNSHQSQAQVLRAEASRDILKFRVSEMMFPGVFKTCFPLQTPCCFLRIHARLGTMASKCPRRSTTSHDSNVSHRSKPQCHSKLGNGCFTMLYDVLIFC